MRVELLLPYTSGRPIANLRIFSDNCIVFSKKSAYPAIRTFNISDYIYPNDIHWGLRLPWTDLFFFYALQFKRNHLFEL
ncbi:unknown [Porphyromonas sp. CAG:1061]|nr:unknown [Porphyromonas sp. CAG:1061]